MVVVVFIILWLLATLIAYGVLEYIDPVQSTSEKIEGMAALLVMWPIMLVIVILKFILKLFVIIGDWLADRIGDVIERIYDR